MIEFDLGLFSFGLGLWVLIRALVILICMLGFNIFVGCSFILKTQISSLIFGFGNSFGLWALII